MASLRFDAWVSRKGQRLEKTTESYQEYSLSILGSLMTEMQAGAAQEGRGRVGGNIYVWNEDLKFPDLLDLPPERIEVQKITNQIEQNNKLKGSSQGLFQNEGKCIYGTAGTSVNSKPCCNRLYGPPC
jgi:hypothetical protein